MRAVILPAILGLLAIPSSAYTIPNLFRQEQRSPALTTALTSDLQPGKDYNIRFPGKEILGVHPTARGEALAHRGTHARGSLGSVTYLKQLGLSVLDKRVLIEVVVPREGEQEREKKQITTAASTEIKDEFIRNEGAGQEGVGVKEKHAQTDTKPYRSPSFESGEKEEQNANVADIVEKADIQQHYLEQLELLKADHLQADGELETKQAAERKKMRDEQQAAVDRIMKQAGGRTIKEFAYKEDDTIKLQLIPLHILFETSERGMLVRQKTAKVKLLEQQKQGLQNLRDAQVSKSEKLGFEYAEKLGQWVSAYQQELENKAKPKVPPPKPNPIAYTIPVDEVRRLEPL